MTLLTLLVVCILPSTVRAETRYVSDLLIINLRSAIEQPYKVVGRVRSNDPLQVIDTEGNYSLVRTVEGVEGWISSQYLTDSKPKPLIISELQSRNQELSSELEQRTDQADPESLAQAQKHRQELVRQNESMQQINNELIAEVQNLKEQLDRLKQQRVESDAADAASMGPDLTSRFEQLRAERDLLEQQNEELTIKYQRLIKELEEPDSEIASHSEQRFDQLRRQNLELQRSVASLENKTMIYWFLAGALVFVCGLFFGKVFSRKTRRFG